VTTGSSILAAIAKCTLSRDSTYLQWIYCSQY